MSDLFGNHIVGFPTRRLICRRGIKLLYYLCIFALKVVFYLNDVSVNGFSSVCIFKIWNTFKDLYNDRFVQALWLLSESYCVFLYYMHVIL